MRYTALGMRLGKTLVGDMNSDGRNDVVVWAQEAGFWRVLIYFQGATGRLDSPTVLPLKDFQMRSLAVGDLNGDGATDLAVIGEPFLVLRGYPPHLLVFYQNPTLKKFEAERDFSVSAFDALDVSIGDLNADGRNDIVISSLWVTSPGQGRLTVRYQQAGGNLGAEVIVDAVGVIPGELKIADLTGDAYNDVVVQSDMLTLAILPQLANHTLSATPSTYSVATSYWGKFDAFAVGDLNDDGKNDAVVLDPGNGGYVNVFIQGSDGRLTRSTPLTLDVPPFGVEIADINGDGLNDIVGEDVSPGFPWGVGKVHVLFQTATHDFERPVTFTFETISGGGSLQYQSLAMGDVTGDGIADVVVTWKDEGLWVLPGIRVAGHTRRN